MAFGGFAIIDIFVLAGGIALGVYYHDTILKWYQGAATFATNLENKAAAIKTVVATTPTPPAAK